MDQIRIGINGRTDKREKDRDQNKSCFEVILRCHVSVFSYVVDNKGRESVSPAACEKREKGIDTGVFPVLSMHHINVLKTVEIQRFP